MLGLIRKIILIRKENKEKIWLMHIFVTSVIFLFSYLPMTDLVIISGFFSLFYNWLCIYSVFRSQHDKEFMKKYIFIIYGILIHSLFFFTIDFEERGLDYFQITIVINIFICLLIIGKFKYDG